MDENAPATKRRKLSEADMRLVHKTNSNIVEEPTAENDTKDHGTSCQKTEEANIVNKQIPAILDPRNGYALVKIVNQLDPTSFVKLARTCRAMHDFCFTSKDIKISFNIDAIFCDQWCGGQYTLRTHFYKFIGNKDFESAWTSNRIRDLYPFVFSIGTLHDDDEEWILTKRGITIVRWLLDDLPIQKISKVFSTLVLDAVSWDSIFRFLQDFNVETVIFTYGSCMSSRVPEEVTRRLVTSGLKMLSFGNDLEIVNQTAILDATVPILELCEMKLSDETFDALVLKCINSTLNIDWRLGFENRNSPFELHDRGLYKSFPFNYDGPIPEERPVVFVKEDDPLHFCMLRKDNTIFRFAPHYYLYYHFCVSKNPNKWPPCLRSVGIPIDLRKTLSIT